MDVMLFVLLAWWGWNHANFPIPSEALLVFWAPVVTAASTLSAVYLTQRFTYRSEAQLREQNAREKARNHESEVASRIVDMAIKATYLAGEVAKGLNFEDKEEIHLAFQRKFILGGALELEHEIGRLRDEEVRTQLARYLRVLIDMDVTPPREEGFFSVLVLVQLKRLALAHERGEGATALADRNRVVDDLIEQSLRPFRGGVATP